MAIPKVVAQAEEITVVAMNSATSELALATEFQVSDQVTLERADEWCREIKENYGQLEDKRVSLKAGALQTCRDIDAFFKPAIAALEEVEVVLKDKANDYEQKQLYLKEQAEKEAKAKAEKERKRKEDLAKKAMARGDIKKAKEHIEKSMEVVTEVVEETFERPESASISESWYAEVTDFEKLILAVADSITMKRKGEQPFVTIPTDALLPNKTHLNKAAKAMKDQVRWPGVDFKKKITRSISK